MEPKTTLGPEDQATWDEALTQAWRDELGAECASWVDSCESRVNSSWLGLGIQAMAKVLPGGAVTAERTLTPAELQLIGFCATAEELNLAGSEHPCLKIDTARRTGQLAQALLRSETKLGSLHARYLKAIGGVETNGLMFPGLGSIMCAYDAYMDFVKGSHISIAGLPIEVFPQGFAVVDEDDEVWVVTQRGRMLTGLTPAEYVLRRLQGRLALD